jgi:hypothetical protein
MMMEKDLREFIEKGVASEFCEVEDVKKLGFRARKSLQMKGMWKGVEMAEKEGLTVYKLPISEAWEAVKKFIEKPEELKPFCEIPITKEGELR